MAWGSLLRAVKYLDLTDAVPQNHDLFVLHINRYSFEFETPFSWCVSDNQYLSSAPFNRNRANFLQAKVKGVGNGEVQTSRGLFGTKCVVDASGWRAALA